ncbi:hypothetical protein ACFE04_004172 [Oxalis oulophora]
MPPFDMNTPLLQRKLTESVHRFLQSFIIHQSESDAPPNAAPLPSTVNSSIRVTSAFNSEDTPNLFHKISFNFIFDEYLSKLKLSFNSNHYKQFYRPHVSFTSEFFSALYDVDHRHSLITSAFDLGSGFTLSASHDYVSQFEEHRVDLALRAKLHDPRYELRLGSGVSSAVGLLPNANFKFPNGEVSFKTDVLLFKKYIWSAIGKGQLLGSILSAEYRDEDLKLKYRYKDEAFTFISSASLLYDPVEFKSKFQLTPSDKLSLRYNFHTDDRKVWNAAYKHTYGKDFKFKAAYDSKLRLGIVFLRVEDEESPLGTKLELKLDVPHDHIEQTFLVFQLKTRLDF